MRLLCLLGSFGFCTLAFADFDHYRVTDLGLPAGHRAVSYLFPSGFSNNGTASAVFYTTQEFGVADRYRYQGGSFTQFPSTGNTRIQNLLPSNATWIGTGSYPTTDQQDKNGGYYLDGTFHEILPQAGWHHTAFVSASETKYLAGAEIQNSGTEGTWRGMLYDVATGTKTYLPQLGQQTWVNQAFDDGSALVTAISMGDPLNAHGAVYKNGAYQSFLDDFNPIAMNKAGVIAGDPGVPAFGMIMWRNGVFTDFFVGVAQQATGISDAGIVSAYNSSLNWNKSCYVFDYDLGAMKLNDLVVNKPSNMNIYGATINASGHMFGQALVGNEHHFVLLDPVPEAAAYMILSIGILALLRRKKNTA